MHKTLAYDVDYYSTVLDKICLSRDRRLVERLIRIFIIFPFMQKCNFLNFGNIVFFSRSAFFLSPNFLSHRSTDLHQIWHECVSLTRAEKRRGRFLKSSKTRSQRTILTVKYLGHIACVWTAVRSVYGQPKSKNGNIFQALLL